MDELYGFWLCILDRATYDWRLQFHNIYVYRRQGGLERHKLLGKACLPDSVDAEN